MKSIFFVVVAVLLVSCNAYRYFPVRPQVYNFDTAGDWRVPLDIGLTGGSAAVAHSPVNHLAIAAQTHANVNITLDERNFGYGGGGGVGIYGKLGQRQSYDLFLSGDVQRVKTNFMRDTLKHRRLLNTYRSFRLQPIWYYRVGDVNLFAACGVSAIASNRKHYYAQAPTAFNNAWDVHIEPSAGLITKPPVTLTVGVAPVISLFHGTNAQTQNAFGQFDAATKAKPHPVVGYFVNITFTDSKARQAARRTQRNAKPR